MQAALNHELRAARVDGLLDFAQNFFVRQEIRAAPVFSAEERAELAFVLADVGIVYIAVDDESHHVAEKFFANCVGALAERQKVAVREKFQRRILRQSQIDSPRSKRKNPPRNFSGRIKIFLPCYLFVPPDFKLSNAAAKLFICVRCCALPTLSLFINATSS